MNIKKLIWGMTLAASSLIAPQELDAQTIIYRAHTYIDAINGRWQFQAWWRIRMMVENTGTGIGGFYFYCINTDEVMEGNLRAGEFTSKVFENRNGGTWYFTANTTGNSSGLYAAVVDE